MNKVIVYILLIVCSLYISMVAGRILGDFENGGNETGHVVLPEGGANNNSIIEAFNPFSFLVDPNPGEGNSLIARGDDFDNEDVAPSVTKSRRGNPTGSGFFDTGVKSQNNQQSYSSNSGVGGFTKSKARNVNNEQFQQTNPFGGFLSSVNTAGETRANMRGQNSNPVGTVGARVGDEENAGLNILDGPLPPEPEPIPFEGGGLFALAGGLIIAAYTFRKKFKILAS